MRVGLGGEGLARRDGAIVGAGHRAGSAGIAVGRAFDASPRGQDIERYERRVKERVKLTIAAMRKYGGEK
jgi:hypothetical protein